MNTIDEHELGPQGWAIDWFHMEGSKDQVHRGDTWTWGLCFEYVLIINVLLFQWLAYYKKEAAKSLLVI